MRIGLVCVVVDSHVSPLVRRICTLSGYLFLVSMRLIPVLEFHSCLTSLVLFKSLIHTKAKKISSLAVTCSDRWVSNMFDWVLMFSISASVPLKSYAISSYIFCLVGTGCISKLTLVVLEGVAESRH